MFYSGEILRRKNVTSDRWINNKRFSSFQSTTGFYISEREGKVKKKMVELTLNLLQFMMTSNHGIICYLFIFLFFCCCLEAEVAGMIIFWVLARVCGECGGKEDAEILLEFFLNGVLMFSRAWKQFAAYFYPEAQPMWPHVHFQPKAALIFCIDFLSLTFNLNSKVCKWYLNYSSCVNVLQIFVLLTDNVLPSTCIHIISQIDHS